MHLPRKVRLSGEARFEVAHDADRPFSVQSGEIHTEVLGTVFDVNAYPGSHAQVILYEGRVRIGHKHKQFVTLEEVMKHIGTWYNVSIIAQSDPFLKRRIHFRFPRKVSLHEVVTALNDLGIARITVNRQTLQVEKP